MTNEEKLLKLLQVAVENGWKPFKEWLYNPKKLVISDNTINDNTVIIGLNNKPYYNELSLNDLVTNWEVDEVSFIEALCKADEDAVNVWNDFIFGDNSPYVTSWVNIILFWEFDAINKKPRPTSQRLQWLFKTFSHLFKKNND